MDLKIYKTKQNKNQSMQCLSILGSMQTGEDNVWCSRLHWTEVNVYAGKRGLKRECWNYEWAIGGIFNIPETYS